MPELTHPRDDPEIRFDLRARTDTWDGSPDLVTSVTAVVGTRLEAGTPVFTTDRHEWVTPLRGSVHRVDLVPGGRCRDGMLAAGLTVDAVEGCHHGLLYLMELGMGWTLWANTSDAIARYDSYVDPDVLPITHELRTTLHRLAALSSIGWQRQVPGQEHLSGPTDDRRELTPPEEAELADLRPESIASDLRAELGPGHSVVVSGLRGPPQLRLSAVVET